MAADRRAFLGTALGLYCLPTDALCAPADARLDAGAWTEQEALRAFVRMRSGLPGRSAVWIYSGVLIAAVLEEIARPLVRIEGVSINHFNALDAGRYRYELEEVGYYCDLHAGAVLDSWTNPFTTKVVKPKHYRSSQTLLFAGSRIEPMLSTRPAGVTFTGEITRPVIIGESLWMGEDLYVKTAAARTQASLATFRSRAADLATSANSATSLDAVASAATWVDCDFNYGTMNGFVGWLGMADRPGLQNMRLVGRKFPDGASVPVWLRERIERDHPDFAARL